MGVMIAVLVFDFLVMAGVVWATFRYGRRKPKIKRDQEKYLLWLEETWKE